jgi:hypothetical protein
MGRKGRGRAPKDPYEGLSPEWRAAVDGGTDEEIKAKLAEAALEFRQIEEDKASDGDYVAAKQRLSSAGAQYRERSKAVKLKCKFAKKVLESRGKL